MALEESIDGLEKIEANGVSAYIDPNLKAFLNQFGSFNVDYIQREVGNSGFTIKVTGFLLSGSPLLWLQGSGIKRLDEVVIFDKLAILDAGVAQFG